VLIDRIELRVVRNELVHEFETSSHRKSYLDHVLIRVVTADGFEGWGECASPSDPYYCGETTETCWQVLVHHLAPLVLGVRWDEPVEIARLLGKVSGNHFARAGLEMASWDLYGRARGARLADLLGGTQPAVSSGVSLGVEPTIGALLQQVDKHVADGYHRVKLKIRPGWDVEPVRAVRAAYPDVLVQVDANCGYRPDQRESLLALDGLGLAMIEQPFAADDLLSSAALAKDLETPLCLDESITSPAMLRTALALGAGSIINVKVSRLGGIVAAVEVHDLCLDAGVPVWCGGMHEFGVGRAANLAVASLPNFRFPSDVSGSDKYYRRDVVVPPITSVDGMVRVPRGPGIGVDIDPAVLAEHTRRVHRMVSDGRVP